MIFHDLLGNIETEAGPALSLFGREVGVENLIHLRGINPRSAVFYPNIDVELFPGAINYYRTFFIGRCLDRVNDNVLNRSVYLDRVAHQNAFVVAEIFEYVCGLGDIQRDVVYEAIRDCYQAVGFGAGKEMPGRKSKLDMGRSGEEDPEGLE